MVYSSTLKAYQIAIKYPKSKSSFIARIAITAVATLFITFLLIKNFNAVNVESLASSFLLLVGIFDCVIRVHQLGSYDEISIENDTFIVKKSGIVLSQTPIDTIDIYTTTNPFNFAQASWKRVYSTNTLLFHYATMKLTKMRNLHSQKYYK